MAHASWRGRMGRNLALATGCTALLALTVLVGRTEPARAADPPKTGAADSTAEVVKFINDNLDQVWKDNKVTPSAVCTDNEFIRRASLDVIGRIAKPDEVAKFVEESKSIGQQKARAALIDRLLQSEDYPRNWANLWSNWLLTRTGPFGRGEYHEEMHVWLEDKFANNKEFSYDKIVRGLITATGKNTENGAVNFILAHVGEAPENKEESQFNMVPITARITRLFLGVQTQCTQCHDHPFEKERKQRDFWGVNAFLRQVERTGNPTMRNNVVTTPPLELKINTSANAKGLIKYEQRNGVRELTKPVFLNGSKLSDEEIGKDRRDKLADLIVEHPNFPKAYVNRMWAHFFGRGFTNPIDDFTSQNEPTNKELLDGVAAQFKHYGYDQKQLIRWICNSKAYSLSAVANKTNFSPETEPLFSRMLLKPLTPEAMFESLIVATVPETTKDTKKDLRDKWMTALVANFGDDEGNEVNYSGTVVQALLMMNGSDINGHITDPKGTVAVLVGKHGVTKTGEIVRDLYLHALNRPPTENELKKIERALPLNKSSLDKDPKDWARFADLYWALLNSNEFILNH
jgi:Protein of unknown function (DUF1549)/Protein of unknown function (DUF1553)